MCKQGCWSEARQSRGLGKYPHCGFKVGRRLEGIDGMAVIRCLLPPFFLPSAARMTRPASFSCAWPLLASGISGSRKMLLMPNWVGRSVLIGCEVQSMTMSRIPVVSP